MQILLLILLTLLISDSTLAGGDDETTIHNTYYQNVGGATEATQLGNKHLLQENSAKQNTIINNQNNMLINQAESLVRQLTQINDMVQNTKTVGNFQWGNTSNLLKQLASVVRQGQALSYIGQNIDERFKTLYPGYEPSTNYSENYRNWSETAMDTIRAALNSVNLQANDFATEDSLINQLQQLSSTIQGRLQGIQVGHMIAVENVQQLRKLRQLQMAHMQAQNNYLAKGEQENSAKRAAEDIFFNVPDPTQNKKYKGFRGGSK